MHKAIEWFARNHVAANLLMLLIIFMGLRSALVHVPLEVFPTYELDIITAKVNLPGATPEEAEESLAIRIEEAVYDLDGIEEITSVSREGGTTVSIEVMKNHDLRDLMSDIKTRVDAINTFPADAERPVVSQAQRNREVISVTVSGPLSEKELRTLGTEVREEILALDGITQVYLESVRPFEISIEISEQVLRRYQLTMGQVAQAIESHSLDLSGGMLRTRGGEILIRTKSQAYTIEDFAAIPVRSETDGTRIKLGDIANIQDTFDQSPINVRFNGKNAILIEVYRIGAQNAITVANTVKEYVLQKQESLPDQVVIHTWRDRSLVVKARLQTLGNSALQGGILVALLLSLFLRPAIAFWVCVGIPISFLGGFWIMALQNVTLNLISLFAFITVLGIVVDDAIVTGENIYFHLQQGEPPQEAVIIGTREVAVPVTFGILTTMVAFYPLMSIDGVRGQIFAQIPAIVIPVLFFSLVESKLILPSHLKHVKQRKDSELGPLSRLQKRIADGFEQAIIRFYKPLLQRCLKVPAIPMALATGLLIIILALILGGWTRFVFFPKIPSELVRATLVMPTGTSFEITDRAIDHMVSQAQILKKKYSDPNSGESVIVNILATTGSAGGRASGMSHIGRVLMELQPPETRVIDVTSKKLVKEWRKMIGTIPGMESMTMRAEFGRGGSPIDVQLTGTDFRQLREIADLIKKQLVLYPEVFDIEDSLAKGKQELQLHLLPQGEALGLSQADLALQVRHAFFGYEVQRILRGRDDVRVFLRYTEEERSSLSTLDNLLIRTADNREIPFLEVAALTPGQSPSEIRRIAQRRALNVTADLDKQNSDIEAIKRSLTEFMDNILPRYPGITYSLEGEAKEQRQSFSGLKSGIVLVLFVIYGLLAIPFRSYWQPFIVISMIPFGAIGAVIGHWIMGIPLTIMSLMGMLALTGVVVNDSLVLVDYINRQRREGQALMTAVRRAGVARFRAVLLTSLTTFAGLTPLIFEKSTQAQFLIPMAISLGFGIIFATFFTLLLLPVTYLLFARTGMWVRGQQIQ
ncbi:MAG: efflux RND transporter permease subunit [Desulfobulbaceae bacterium]|uniref:Efflux RND transporter permease subunit n=1 Tax=Candidatus Desulfatifera sulfidica TaxID=2841691 RepID=A0A8J6N9A3_9BACT|nr:efflux RND transporter permease subunit [Candidatus Desulfatifera sulfidica]